MEFGRLNLGRTFLESSPHVIFLNPTYPLVRAGSITDPTVIIPSHADARTVTTVLSVMMQLRDVKGLLIITDK